MLLDLLKSRRSIRKYEPKKVERDKIDTILKSALLSPSSRGRKPWEFVVVTNEELLLKLSYSREHGSSFLAGAAVGIVVIADPQVGEVWIEDTSITAIIMQLSAQSLGLGSCWIQVRERFHSQDTTTEEYIKEILGIPGKYKVECMLAVGYPGEEKEGYGEEGFLSEKIHEEQY